VADGYISAAVHAPSSGTVTALEERPVAHPSGLSASCLVLETDGLDEWCELPSPMANYLAVDPAVLRQRVREAGIVGLGGAAFPTAVKLNPGPNVRIQLLILNGAECEPYITCDDMLMRERAREIIGGLLIMRHALQVSDAIIGLEDNKSEAYQALAAALADFGNEAAGIVIKKVATIYPAGGEKQLIRVLTGREVPSHGIPAEIGIVCHNVGTAAAVFAAVMEGRPLLSRYLTVTGKGVRRPQVLEVLLGTPVSYLIEQCGGYTDHVERLVMGGPMMGFALHSDAVPVVKGSNCILAASAAEIAPPAPAMPCIRCGACAEMCPVNLLPQQLYWYAKAKDFDKVQDYHLFDCIECGCCAAVCPSHIPLIQYYRFAKTELWAQERDKQKADIARQRHEFHQNRVAREKQEKEAALRKRKAALQKETAAPGKEDPKKAAIEAAVARAKAKKAVQKSAPPMPLADGPQEHSEHAKNTEPTSSTIGAGLEAKERLVSPPRKTAVAVRTTADAHEPDS
jgi:electron transport complex protein RnfC